MKTTLCSFVGFFNCCQQIMPNIWILVIIGLTAVLQTIYSATNDDKCRSKFGNFEPPVFKIHACAWCYYFITQSREVFVHPTMHALVFRKNQTVLPQYAIIVADAENRTMADIICKTTNADMCARWKSCCHEATDCCKRQIEAPPGGNGTCPRTWDGYGCWDDTAPGTTVYIGCPDFLKFSVATAYAEKRCTDEGIWFALGNSSKPQRNEWTDYTKCLDKNNLFVSIYLGLACNIASIALLLPATGIFIIYRSLRKQHRIRLHINLFVALMFSNILTVMWEMLVAHEKLTGSSTSFIFQSPNACNLLAFLRLYSRSTTYVWMFCEGFYLHRLISNAFKPPKSLLFLYLIGWGFPLCYTTIYGILRLIYANEACWIKSTGNLQWILYAPNLGCLKVNLLFLCNILRILLTQLQSHPNEPSNFRRALKATFVLIPLFGVQLFVTIYRLPAGSSGATQYEKFSVFVLNSQGFFVALIFCFFNGEVISHLKRTCSRLRLMRRFQTDISRGQTTATSVNFIHHGPDSHESENGNLVYESPRSSPHLGKKVYDSMEQNERKYPYIPLVTRQQTVSPTEI